MPEDKSFFYYGSLYKRLFDPQLAEARQVAAGFISEGSSVLDIACGTGQLCFELREKKRCRVVGLDLSRRMLGFARQSNPSREVTFVHGDATDLSDFGDRSFDYATLLMVMHELPRSQQTRVLKEALRVAHTCVVIDSVAPLPRNARGIGIRFVEATFGHDHQPHFKRFLETDGIRGILEESGLPINVAHQSVFGQNCREVQVVSAPH
jgi:ubiquinone/menaquinone biosynthesis C-methylase UbiE